MRYTKSNHTALSVNEVCVMKTIASFQVDHTRLQPGLYISRVDGDVVTYDLRFIRPNTPPFLEYGVIHTLEHLMAVYLRNSQQKDHILYFGPMGCRTGFYLLTRNLPHSQVISLIKQALTFVRDFTGDIPGATARECGNYLEHDLEGAKRAVLPMLDVMEHWTEERLDYEGEANRV